MNVGVSVGKVINVDCISSTQQHRYVIVQSLDTAAEKLCIAEVSIYQGGQYELMLASVHMQCLSVYSGCCG